MNDIDFEGLRASFVRQFAAVAHLACKYFLHRIQFYLTESSVLSVYPCGTDFEQGVAQNCYGLLFKKSQTMLTRCKQVIWTAIRGSARSWALGNLRKWFLGLTFGFCKAYTTGHLHQDRNAR